MNNEFSINNRRYLGNKYKLLPFIKEVVTNHCKNINVFADLFAGTGVVASAFSNTCKVILNDILYSNFICNYAWFSAETYNKELLMNILNEYNDSIPTEANYMSIYFSNTYFSEVDCLKIGYVREDIEKKYLSGSINERERSILITSLIYAMDKIAKTCGHYDAYRKDVVFDDSLYLRFPDVSLKNNRDNKIYNQDINTLVSSISADLVYLDPPYNSRQYCDAYHLLENVARWEKPKITGVARKMDRSNIKSKYCTRSAVVAFEDLIKNLNTRYILLSYNNMGTKGNERSNAKITDDDILRILKTKGDVKVFSEDYRAFSAGKSEIIDNKERLFLCCCEK